MSRKHLSTARIAAIVGVHPNTVRLYEHLGYLSTIPRSPSGYRLFTEYHLEQMKLAWIALKFPYPGGKAPVEELVRKAAAGELGVALELAYHYLDQVRAEIARADSAIVYLERWANGNPVDRVPAGKSQNGLSIGQVAEYLGTTRDSLRNWERNGLINVPRNPGNGYRIYTGLEIGRLRVIRMLTRVGYSQMAILRMVTRLDQGEINGLRQALDITPDDEDIYYITDRWMSTLKAQEQRALGVIEQVEFMIQKFENRV
jgi:DNA-binding transcriptional MerR regulator